MVDAPNAPPSQIHMQIMWNRLIAVVEEQAQTLMRTAFSTSVREAGDLSAGVFDRDGRMLAQAVTGTPGHVNSMATAVQHFLDALPARDDEAGRPLHHQRSVADLRPSARHHRRHARPSSAASRSGCSPAPSMSSISAGSAWGRTGGRCSRKACHPDHAAAREGAHERGPAAHRARQCARAAAGRGRHLRAAPPATTKAAGASSR